MVPRNAFARSRNSGQWSSRLWLFAAVLGALTLYAMANAVHGTRQRRQLVRTLVSAVTRPIAEGANHRLEVLTLQAFAPALPGVAAARLTGRAAVTALVHAQQERDRCDCNRTVHGSRFFRFDIASHEVDILPAMRAGDSLASIGPALMGELAQRQADRAHNGNPSLNALLVDPRLGTQGIVTYTELDSTGPVAIYGMLANLRDLGRELFGPPDSPSLFRDSAVTLILFDSLSLQVRTRDSVLVFGANDSTRHVRVTAVLHGPLEGLVAHVALEPAQLAFPLIAPIPADQLWPLGALTLCTILLITLAVSSSRREALLARARSEFIAGVSHELRMPLAQILLASETLAMQRERGESDRLTLASSIVRETRRLIALVNNVLLFSRSGAVKLEPRLQPLPADELLDEVVESVQLAVEDAGQTIEVDAAPIAVLGDRHLLRQALVNLVDNALKYGARGQCIRLACSRHGASSVHLMVQDDGPGVPAAERARLFQPYERLARDQDSERTGTGLGLAVVHQIVRACGGRVWLEESEGGGTRAVLEMPLAELSAVQRSAEVV